jgi:pyrroline-5-carboxylate reductase
MALPTAEKTLFAFDPISRIVPTTTARITASMTAYSAMSRFFPQTRQETQHVLTSLTSET